MTAREHALEHKPEPPRWSAYLAVVLELAIVAVLAAHHSVAGLVLALAYAWYSATWSLFVWTLLRRKDE